MKKVISVAKTLACVAIAAFTLISCGQGTGRGNNAYGDDVNIDCAVSSWQGDVDCYGHLQITLAMRITDNLVFGQMQYDGWTYFLASLPSEESFFACDIFFDEGYMNGTLMAQPNSNGTLTGYVSMGDNYFNFELTKCDAPEGFVNPFYHKKYEDIDNFTAFSYKEVLGSEEERMPIDKSLLLQKKDGGFTFRSVYFDEDGLNFFNSEEEGNPAALAYENGKFEYNDEYATLKFEVFENFLYVTCPKYREDHGLGVEFACTAGIYEFRASSNEYSYELYVGKDCDYKDYPEAEPNDYDE